MTFWAYIYLCDNLRVTSLRFKDLPQSQPRQALSEKNNSWCEHVLQRS